MRKVLHVSALASLLAFTFVATTGCKQEDPNAFETHTAKLKDPETRGQAMADLQRLAKSAASSENEERMKEFGDKVLPVFAEIWDDAPEARLQMLEMARDTGQTSASVLWDKAVALDGTGDGRKATLLALQGIRTAKAVDSAGAVEEQLTALIADPSKDAGEPTGEVRLEYAKTLGDLGQVSSVPVLIKVVESEVSEDTPAAIHRQAIKALGDIGDPSAIPALLTAPLRVPDGQSTTNVFNRTMLALVHIGKPSVDPALKMFRGENPDTAKLAADQGLDDSAVKMISGQFLGALGDNAATADLVAFMPKDDCVEDAEPNAENGALRMTIARQLGYVGDEAAVEGLCSCSTASHNHDMDEIAQALGWIGGDKAAECLVNVMNTAEFSLDAVANSDFKYEIRWEAARFAVLAATPESLPKVKESMAAQEDAKVKEEMTKWDSGIKLIEECKADDACYRKTLDDANAEWFPREVAAHQLSRIKAGDKETAIAISKAFKVRNPDARVSMAILAPRVAGGKCNECADALQAVLTAEKGTMDAKMQLAVLKSREGIAKMSEGATSE